MATVSEAHSPAPERPTPPARRRMSGLRRQELRTGRLLFLLERPDRWTVSLGLSRLSGSIEVPSTVLMAGSVVLTVPIVVLFFVAERRLVEGLTAGGEKG